MKGTLRMTTVAVRMKQEESAEARREMLNKVRDENGVEFRRLMAAAASGCDEDASALTRKLDVCRAKDFQIAAALLAIDLDYYGRCIHCGGAIAPLRLGTHPWSVH